MGPSILSIGDKLNSNRFAENIDLTGGSRKLISCLYESVRTNGMGISTEKSKIIVNSTNNISAAITMQDRKLG
ncbi:hypothetical protein DPMN_110214 [Dreissena polymorpha]|uniref:Uncharacterized protein n=1 Tax=Dreissena polymorpha TaxID=45954 RepID=A0A9D4KC63_DREPO|nr:hypothetical protein DPMN_110214 [Dreissena polymorpha]